MTSTISNSTSDHPRACGEHLSDARAHWEYQGSSPRLRGTYRVPFSAVWMPGIIPALAGNIGVEAGAEHDAGDHPRACGEHWERRVDGVRATGSSPRLRGTFVAQLDGHAHRGIIPALAGNISGRRRPATHGRGSSPRLRGTYPIRAGRRAHMGIIPALAGNICASRSFALARSDHPRACGEHEFLVLFGELLEGSSPRLRGTYHRLENRRQQHGIIPALAGNINNPTRLKTLSWDHPRACGEHCRDCGCGAHCVGSSPRLRGTSRQLAEHQARPGIIPALAGNIISQTQSA